MFRLLKTVENEQSRELLYRLCVITGAFGGRELEAVAGVSGEITTQYVLRYVPDVDPEAKTKIFRKIKVDIPGLPNVKLHHRPGYWPNGVPGAIASNAK